MVNFHLPNPQTPATITHAVAGPAGGWVFTAQMVGLFVLPVIVLLGQELILHLIGWWEARHGDQG